jgi:hypothetical protein
LSPGATGVGYGCGRAVRAKRRLVSTVAGIDIAAAAAAATRASADSAAASAAAPALTVGGSTAASVPATACISASDGATAASAAAAWRALGEAAIGLVCCVAYAGVVLVVGHAAEPDQVSAAGRGESKQQEEVSDPLHRSRVPLAVLHLAPIPSSERSLWEGRSPRPRAAPAAPVRLAIRLARSDPGTRRGSPARWPFEPFAMACTSLLGLAARRRGSGGDAVRQGGKATLPCAKFRKLL